MVKNFLDKTILVTGGTGFVGSHLVEQLLKEGAHVITTVQSLDPHSYFLQQKLDRNTTMVSVDIVHYDRLFNVITANEIEYIFHLAAQPLVETAFYNPRRTLDTNIQGTVNILECTRLYPGIKGVIVASSDKVYGKQDNKKYLETDALRGDHPYEVSKSAADLIACSYYKTYGIPVVTTRFGNIYGEGDLHYSRIIPGIMKSLIRNEVLAIRSNGKYVRDYIYVKDVVEGYVMLAQSIEKVAGDTFNFGSQDTHSVVNLVTLIEKVLKKKVGYKIKNIAQNEIPYQSLNFEKIKKRLNWRPKHTLRKTTPKIYQWYKKIL